MADIKQIAQEMIDRLLLASEEQKLRAEGVAMLCRKLMEVTGGSPEEQSETSKKS